MSQKIVRDQIVDIDVRYSLYNMVDDIYSSLYTYIINRCFTAVSLGTDKVLNIFQEYTVNQFSNYP